MQKDQRNLIVSIAMAGTVLASLAAPAAAAGVVAANGSAFMKYNEFTVVSKDVNQATPNYFLKY